MPLTQEERTALQAESNQITERMKGDFVDPKDFRRQAAITSLLLTDGQTEKVELKFVRGRGGNKGLNVKKGGYYRKGRVG